MKVLIADDERLARRILETSLIKEGYEVVHAEDGASALKCALTFTEPYIAVLDWVMPGLSGPQVCLCLRSPKLKIRPYIVVLSGRSDKGDIAAALDAGADDFLSKPFSQIELTARLRVATRTLHFQADLQQQIGQLEALAKRYNLLGEIVAQQSGNRLTASPMMESKPAQANAPALDKEVSAHEKGPGIPAGTAASSGIAEAKPSAPARVEPGQAKPAAIPTATAAAPAKADQPRPAPVDLSPEESDQIMQRVIAEMGFGNVGVLATVANEAYKAADYTAWAGMILEREQVWLDLLLDVDASAMAMIFEQTLGRRPASDEERENFLAETHTIVSAGFKSALLAKGVQVLSPLLSRVMRTKGRAVPLPAKREMHRYVLAGVSVGLTVVRYECLLKLKPTNRLRSSDIMADAYPPPGENEMPLLSKGTVLSERFIEKLANLEEGEEKKLAVPVYPISPLAAYFTEQK